MSSVHQADVVVIGAGIAGLIAARELAANGQKVVILEANSRLGGRTWTDSRMGWDLEIGGTWVHWSQPHVWAEITRYGLTPIASPKAHEMYWLDENGAAHKGSPLEYEDLISRGQEAIAGLGSDAIPRPDSPHRGPRFLEYDALTLQDGIDSLEISPEEKVVNEAVWAIRVNAPLRSVSLASALRWAAASGSNWKVMREASSGFKLKEGISALVQAVADHATSHGATIHLDSKVSHVAYGEDFATVQTNDSTFEAKHVVSAIPFTVMEDVHFSPPLDGGAKRMASDRPGNCGIKVWIRVRGRVEPFGAYSSQHHRLTCIRSEAFRDNESLLLGFGTDHRKFDLTKGVEQAQEALEIWRNDLEVLEVAGHDWMADPLEQTTWQVTRPGQLSNNFDELLQSKGRLHFAGSDTGQLWGGFIDGAVESALRVSREISRARF